MISLVWRWWRERPGEIKIIFLDIIDTALMQESKTVETGGGEAGRLLDSPGSHNW